jgi:acyl-CoA synthetase (AMP-forming)/AMP-acid ligase II
LDSYAVDVVQGQFAKLGRRPFSLTEHVFFEENQSNPIFDPDPLTPHLLFLWEREKVKCFFRRGREVWEIPESSRTTAGGDLASQDEDGHVFLRGRRKSVINFGGIKFFPEEVEQIRGGPLN